MGKAHSPICDALQVHVVDAVLDEFFASISEVLVFCPLVECFVDCRSIATIWGPVLFGGMTVAAPGKWGSANGGVLLGVAAAYSAAVSTAPKYPWLPPPGCTVPL